MEIGTKLKELNMTTDEVDRLTQAFKDEKFRVMLRDYAQELSDPENMKRYEEEIKILEQERGNTIEFIHPNPFKALRTSVNGKQKCFINICANEKVEKPTITQGVSEEGHRGQCWSLPHSLHPGRQDTDLKGNKIMIYDVIFHPDALHMASRNQRFMDLVDSTAIQGIQSAFNVSLDKNNVKELKTKYKGTPQPCVTRKCIPGYKAKEPSEKSGPLAFPYPDDKRPATSQQTKTTESPVRKISRGAEPKIFHIQPGKTKGPTKPNYTVKYRSFIDLQDFRCSRDSAQSPRPKEIVVTVDVPLLKAVTDASLEVEERRLLLETKKPVYRLELPLAYPVDEDKGEAKFTKQKGQLTVTLPVLPSKEAFNFDMVPVQNSINDDEGQREKDEAEAEDVCKEKERENLGSEVKEDLRQQARLEKGEEEDRRGQEKGGEQIWEGEHSKGEEGICEEDAKWIQAQSQEVKEQTQENEEGDGKLNLQRGQEDDKLTNKCSKIEEDKCDRDAEKLDSWATGSQCDTVGQLMDEETPCVGSTETENQPVLIVAQHPGCRENEWCSRPTPKMKTSDSQETEKTEETPGADLKVRDVLITLQKIYECAIKQSCG